MEFATKCLHAGYNPKNGEPRVQPIVQSTTYTYDSAEEIGKLFDLQAAGYFYTRLANPTTNAAEEKLPHLKAVWRQYVPPQVNLRFFMPC